MQILSCISIVALTQGNAFHKFVHDFSFLWLTMNFLCQMLQCLLFICMHAKLKELWSSLAYIVIDFSVFLSLFLDKKVTDSKSQRVMALHTFHLDNDDKASKKKQDIPTINNAFIFILGNKTTSSYSYDVE